MAEQRDDLEKSNRSKYGDKSTDIISQAFGLGQEYGNFWCIYNVKKYIERFIKPGSSKGGNLTDLVKARDYLQRAIETHPDYSPEKTIKDT